MADKIEALAKECGATFYTHRSSPHAPAVAFGPDAWASFCARALAQGEPGEPQGWKLIGWTCFEGDCGRIHDEPPDALDDFTQAVYVMSAPPTEHEVKHADQA